MKVLILSHISELLGGAERSMLDVVELWVKDYGIEPELILRKPIRSLAGELQKRGWKYHVMDYTFWSDARPPVDSESKFRQASQNTMAVLEIEKIIKKTKPDVVMTNSMVSPWAGVAAHYQGVPHIWFVREYGDLDHGRLFEIGREKTWQDVGKLSSVVITISQALAGHLAKYMPKEKIRILYNPFNIDEIQVKADEPIANPYRKGDSLKLVIIGNLSPSKGQHEVVEAVGRLNDEGFNIELCIVGDKGPDKYLKTVKQSIKKHKIKRKVHFVGRHINPLPFVKNADVCLMTSRREAFGRVTFEYLVLGKPVVGANSGATPEMVKDGVNGFLYKAGDIESLTGSIRKYAIQPNLIAEHGPASVKRAQAMMAGEYNAKDLYTYITEAIKNFKPEQPLHISHQWLSYPTLAQQYIDDTRAISLKIILKQRSRRKAKWIYKNLRTSIAKKTGK